LGKRVSVSKAGLPAVWAERYRAAQSLRTKMVSSPSVEDKAGGRDRHVRSQAVIAVRVIVAAITVLQNILASVCSSLEV
jgi:hypothetical protein